MPDQDREQAYQMWVKNSSELLEEAKKYNQWRTRSKKFLMSNLAPRIDKLGGLMYSGAGFHYDMERRLGNLIQKLSMPIQWHAGNCEKINTERCIIMVWQIAVPMLVKDVVKAEISAKTNCKRWNKDVS